MKLAGHIPPVDSGVLKETICAFIKTQSVSLKRDGAVVGLSGGVDSALCAGLCVEALGKDRVFGLLLPERESDPKSTEYAMAECRRLGIRSEIVDITQTLESAGAYELRNAAIREFFPDYGNQHKSKLVLPGDLLAKNSLNFYTLIIEDEAGHSRSARLNNQALRRIVAGTNLKQRMRMVYLYRFAETHNYLVCGTTNRSESAQGFFVKYGDGGVDIEPIEELYKTQVYQLARFFGVSDEILRRPPTPDTFSLGVTDEEFYFRLPYDKLDVMLYAWESRMPVAEVCDTLRLSREQVERVFRDLASKYNATRHLRALPPVPRLGAGLGDRTSE
jgi:NAD+ synthase